MTKRQVSATPSGPPTASVRTRQLYLTVAIMLLALWMALPFLTPIAWAAVFAIAEWPLYKRAEGTVKLTRIWFVRLRLRGLRRRTAENVQRTKRDIGSSTFCLN